MARQLSGEQESVDNDTDLPPTIQTKRVVQTDKGRATVQMEGFDLASLKKFKPVTFDSDGRMELPPAEFKIKKGKRGAPDERVIVKNGEERYGFNAAAPYELIGFYMGQSGKKRRQVWRGKSNNKLHQQIKKRLIANGIPTIDLTGV